MTGIDAPLSNCKVYIYPGDHNPPHFHLRVRPETLGRIAEFSEHEAD